MAQARFIFASTKRYKDMGTLIYSIISVVVYAIILLVCTVIFAGAFITLMKQIMTELRISARLRQTQVVVTKPQIKKSRTAARPCVPSYSTEA